MTEIVYILTNEAMPGLVKVGRTTTDLAGRIRALFQTGVPLPFELFFACEVNDAAKMLGIHKNTVKQWIKTGGLPALTDCRPHLVLGRDLKRFLEKRQEARRRPCGAGQLYCMKCRAPRRAAGDLLDYVSLSPKTGNLKGICGVCDTFIYRRIARAKIASTFPGSDVAFPQSQQRLAETA